MSLDSWSAHQVRLTLFSSEPFPVAEAGWKLLTGKDESENRVNVPGGRQYSGKHLGGLLALTVALNRIDVVLGIDPTKPFELSDTAHVPVIGRWTDISASFSSMIEPFLQASTNPIIRLAFGANLLSILPSRRDTYIELARMLASVKVDVDSMRELIFRVNWPQASSQVPGLEINRITAWASLIVNANFMQNTGSGLSVVPQQRQQPSHALSLEIDHNTSADRREAFQSSSLVPIFKELLQLANENASRGERP